jgi:hypothetical protein
MAKYLSLSGLETVWGKIRPRLLPSSTSSDSGKVVGVNSTGGYQLQSIDGKEDKSNKVTSISSTSTDTQYPSAKCMWTLIGDIESVLDAIINGT